MRRLIGTLVLAMMLAGCSVASVETPDLAAIPSGSLEAMGDDATGPVVELGSGQAEGLGWRYSIYPSGDGWCTQLEMGTMGSTGCGSLLPTGDAAFGSVGSGTIDSGAGQVVEGIATGETFTVWLIENDSQRRFPATLMPLEPAGLDGIAFLGIAPEGMTVTHAQALARNGEVLETVELP